MISVVELPEYMKSMFPITKKVYIGDLPSYSEEGIAIALEDGYSDLSYFGQKKSLARPLIRITIRSKLYKDGMEAADKINDKFNKFTDDNILLCIATGSPMYLGRTAEKLHEIQLIFAVTLKE